MSRSGYFKPQKSNPKRGPRQNIELQVTLTNAKRLAGRQAVTDVLFQEELSRRKIKLNIWALIGPIEYKSVTGLTQNPLKFKSVKHQYRWVGQLTTA